MLGWGTREVVRIAVMEIVPAEGRPAGQVKRRLRRVEQRQYPIHERVKSIRIECVGHNGSDPLDLRDGDGPIQHR